MTEPVAGGVEPEVEPRPRRRTRRRAAVRIVLVLVLVVALSYALAREWGEVRSEFGRIGWPVLFEAEAALLLGLGGSLMSWRAILADFGSVLPVRVAAHIFFVGQLGKYVPGSVWPVLTQMELGRDHGVPRPRMAAASVVAIGISILVGLLVGLLALPALVSGSGSIYALALLLIPVGLALAHPAVLNRLLAAAARITKRDLPERLTGRGLRRALGFALLTWLLNGLQAWLLARELGADGWRALPLAVGGFALAATLGVLFVIAPAGAGVREAVLGLVLASTLTGAAATALALVSRLLVTVADALVAGGAVLGRSVRRHVDWPG